MLVEHRVEHALVRGRAAHPVRIGDDVLIGPHAHVNSTVADGEVVPVGWVEVGDHVLPPDRHEEIWAIQRGLDLPGTVYGEERGDDLMARVMPRQAAWLGAHRDDRVL
jgi:gamma-carbonic anhydrase